MDDTATDSPHRWTTLQKILDIVHLSEIRNEILDIVDLSESQNQRNLNIGHFPKSHQKILDSLHLPFKRFLTTCIFLKAGIAGTACVDEIACWGKNPWTSLALRKIGGRETRVPRNSSMLWDGIA